MSSWRNKQHSYKETLSICKYDVSFICVSDVGSSYVPVRPPLPLITSRQVDRPNPYVESKQAWLESIDTLEGEKLGIIDLHPDIFGTSPR